MPSIEFEYGFDELKIEIAGVSTGLFFGKATLVSDYRWPEDWSVEEIKFDDGGARLLKSDSRVCADPFTRELFKRCAKVIEADPHAQEFFCEQLAERNQPDPDRAYEERRDEMMFEGHNAASRLEYALKDRVYSASLDGEGL